MGTAPVGEVPRSGALPEARGPGEGAGATALASEAPRKTRCVWKTDEWGNSHDAVELGSDVAIMVYFIYPRTVEVMYITEDFRVLTHHGDSRTSETFCNDTPLSEYVRGPIGREKIQRVCEAVRSGREYFGRLRVSVTVVKPEVVKEVCGGGD